MPNFRETHPSRTCTKTYASHNQYKTPLRRDFNKRCGYCDDFDLIQGGPRTYQIDHFVPMDPEGCTITISPTEYSNLVYSCSFCNRAKWNKWPTLDQNIHNHNNVGFVDPCHNSYHTHFTRNENGEIAATTALGAYMFDEIRLYMKRHAIIWNLDKLAKTIKEIKSLAQALSPEKKEELLNLLLEQDKFLNDLKIEDDEKKK